MSKGNARYRHVSVLLKVGMECSLLWEKSETPEEHKQCHSTVVCRYLFANHNHHNYRSCCHSNGLLNAEIKLHRRIASISRTNM